jgi:hypothetical protein
MQAFVVGLFGAELVDQLLWPGASPALVQLLLSAPVQIAPLQVAWPKAARGEAARRNMIADRHRIELIVDLALTVKSPRAETTTVNSKLRF